MESDRELVRREVDRPPGWRGYWAGLAVVAAAAVVSALLGHVYVMTALVFLTLPVAYGWRVYLLWRVYGARQQGVILDWSRWDTRSNIWFGKATAVLAMAFFGVLFVILMVWAIMDAR